MGFFTPTKWTRQRQPLDLIPACGKCGLEKKCKSPHMPPDGLGRRKTLIVAEGPGLTEDEMNRPLVGNAGAELTKMLYSFGVHLRQDCRITNAIVCRATDEKGRSRKPSVDEVRHCRPNLIKLIDEFRPELIIPLGVPAVQSVLSYAWKDDMTEFDNMARWAGWRIPSRKLNAWVCPTYHPSYLLQLKGRDGVSRNKAAEPIVTRHLREAFALKGRPWATIPDDARRVKIVPDPTAAAKLVREMTARGKPVAFDYETDRLKSYHKESRILCCAVSDGEVSVAYPWHGEAIIATKELVRSDVPKIAANIQFEQNWTCRHLGCEVRNWWWDTVTGAHWRNCQPGICGLKFQAFVLFGVEDYDYYLDTLRESPDNNSNTPNRLSEVDLVDLLRYCAYDALYEVWVAYKQREALPAQLARPDRG